MKSQSPYDGVLLIDKASGMTSHDVVAIVRNRLATQKVGHCGTLDPFATGLLLVVVGRGTKIQDLLMSEDKEYVGTMKLGEVTNTQDRDGEVIETREVGTLDKSVIEGAFAKFHGDFYQIPPMVSAIKKEGVPLYKLARAGKIVEREARCVHVYAHEIRKVHGGWCDNDRCIEDRLKGEPCRSNHLFAGHLPDARSLAHENSAHHRRI